MLSTYSSFILIIAGVNINHQTLPLFPVVLMLKEILAASYKMLPVFPPLIILHFFPNSFSFHNPDSVQECTRSGIC